MTTYRANRKIPILLYHSISSYATKRFEKFCVSPELFHEHMSYLAHHNYTPITVSQFVEKIRYGKNQLLPNNPVILTFDDGFADFYLNALPILEKYHFSATLFIVTAFVGGTSRWLIREGETGRTMLNWKQIGEINERGIECGTHSHTHLQLDTEPYRVVEDEIVRCKRGMEEHIAQKVESFAYPFGYATPEVQQIVKTAGYSSACSVKNTSSSMMDNPFSLARILVTSNTELGSFISLLTRGVSPIETASKQAKTKVWQIFRRFKTRYMLHKRR